MMMTAYAKLRICRIVANLVKVAEHDGSFKGSVNESNQEDAAHIVGILVINV